MKSANDEVNRILDRAIKAARKKLPLRSERQVTANLKPFCENLGEAFYVGAEEAQGEIVARLIKLKRDWVDSQSVNPSASSAQSADKKELFVVTPTK